MLLTIAREILQPVLASHNQTCGNRSEQLNDVSQMILIPWVVVTRVRIKQVVTGGKFKGQASRAPNVCWICVRNTKQNFYRSILSSLYIGSEVIVLQGDEPIIMSLNWCWFNNSRRSKRFLSQQFSREYSDCSTDFEIARWSMRCVDVFYPVNRKIPAWNLLKKKF